MFPRGFISLAPTNPPKCGRGGRNPALWFRPTTARHRYSAAQSTEAGSEGISTRVLRCMKKHGRTLRYMVTLTVAQCFLSGVCGVQARRYNAVYTMVPGTLSKALCTFWAITSHALGLLVRLFHGKNIMLSYASLLDWFIDNKMSL